MPEDRVPSHQSKRIRERVANTREIVVGGGSFRMNEGIVTKNKPVCSPLVSVILQVSYVHEHRSSHLAERKHLMMPSQDHLS